MSVFRPALVMICFISAFACAKDEIKHVMIGSALEPGFDMGINSSGNQTAWLTNMGGHFRLAYPSKQTWGALFITFGKPKDKPRPFIDLSAYKTLTLEMKGAKGGESVAIGMKTNTQPDDGTETKISMTLSKDWLPYQFKLDAFRRADPAQLYVVTEVVFDGTAAQTVMLRNVSFSK